MYISIYYDHYIVISFNPNAYSFRCPHAKSNWHINNNSVIYPWQPEIT